MDFLKTLGALFLMLLTVLTVVIAVVIGVVVYALPNLPGLQASIPQTWYEFLIVVTVALTVALGLAAGFWALRKAFYINRAEAVYRQIDNTLAASIAKIDDNNTRMEGNISRMSIVRDRESLHALRSTSRWFVGSKLDYDSARLVRILDALASRRWEKVAFLCIDTSETDLDTNIQTLRDTVRMKYASNTREMVDVVSRLYLRKIDNKYIQLHMEICDPYVEPDRKVAVYLPHSDEFENTIYDIGLLVEGFDGDKGRRRTAYFRKKAEALWRMSSETKWSGFKRELGIVEDWNEVTPGLQDLDDQQRKKLHSEYDRVTVDWLAQITGLNTAAIEKFLTGIRDSGGSTS